MNEVPNNTIELVDRTDALMLSLGLALTTPLLAGHQSEKFFEWLAAVDAEPTVPGWQGSKPQLLSVVVPLLRSLLSFDGQSLPGDSTGKYSDEETVRMAAKLRDFGVHAKRLWNQINEIGARFEQAHGSASPTDRAN